MLAGQSPHSKTTPECVARKWSRGIHVLQRIHPNECVALFFSTYETFS